MSKSINEEDLNPNKVLESAIHNDNFIDLTDPTATKPSRSTLLPLLSNHDPLPSRKRKLQTFLDSYYEKVDPIPISSSDEEEEVEVVERDPEVNAALDKLKFPIDRLFQQSLKLHQIEGLEFMWDRIYNKRQGCLLAHSMGLGKTLQVISLITTMYQHLQKNPESKFPTVNIQPT
jgi:SNF2 family DNA or RNA helicase